MKTTMGTPEDRSGDSNRKSTYGDLIRSAALHDPKLNAAMGKADHTGKMEPVMNPSELGEEVRMTADFERARGEYQALHDEKDE